MREPSRRKLRRAVKWLPVHVLAAALLALAAAAAACDVGEPPTTTGAPPDTADQVLFGMEHNLTVDGVRRVRVEADTAYFYQRNQVAELLGVRVEFYSELGALTSTVTSIEGTYQWRTGDMEARGDVVAVTPDDRRLTTSILRFNRGGDEITGPEAFVFDAPDQHLEGDGFVSDPNFTNVVTERPRQGRMGEVDAGR